MLKSEFAEKFYNVSTETLRMWIKGKKELLIELDAVGYKNRSKLLKPKEIEIIRKYFG